MFLKFHAKEAKAAADAAAAKQVAGSLVKAADDTRKKTGLLYTSSLSMSRFGLRCIGVWV